MAEKVKIDVAVVGAQQAAAQTKTLKQQIKDLRTELEGLTQGTDEYNAKLTELGNAMHQQQEITEQARMATEDYGATLGNLSSVANGVVGSIAAVNGVMNLVGANSKGAEEVVKTMTSLIGIMQGLSALDSAEKNFAKLFQKIKLTTTSVKENTTAMKGNSVAAKEDAVSMGQATTATKAQGVAAATTTKATNLLSVGFRKLGLAIKAFMMSNPFTLILLAITTIYTIVSNIIDKQREATEEMRRQKEELRKMNDAVILGEKGQTSYTQEQMQMGGMIISERQQDAGNNKTMDPTVQSNIDAFAFLKASQKETLQAMENENKKYTEEYTNQFRKYINDLKENYQWFINWYEKEYYRISNLTVDDMEGNSKGDRNRNLMKEQEKLKDYEESVKGYYVNLYEIYMAGQQYEKELAKSEEERLKESENARKKAAEDAKSALEKAKNDALARIKTAYDLARKLEENAYANQETTTDEHYARLKEIEDTYYAEYTDIMNGNIKTYKKYIAKYNEKQQALESAEANHASAILSIEKDLATELQKIRAWETDPSRGIALSRAEREKDDAVAYYNQVKEDNERLMIAEEQTRQQRLDFDAGWFYTKLKMLERYNRDAAKLEREATIESLRIQQERKEQEIAAIGTNYNQNLSDENTQYEHDLQVLKDQYEARLITQQEYEQRGEELTNEHLIRLRELEASYTNDIAQAEADLSDTRLQIQREEFAMEQELFEQKKEMIKTYVSAFSSILGAVSSLLSEVQNKYKEGTKEYEKIAETMLIMQTIEGSLAAFVSGVESGLPAPWNFALGAVLAGLATATGVLAINNLKSKKLSSSAANAPNVNPYETLSYETNSNIEGNIADTRVYVLEEDISSTQNRVTVAETEASW